MRVSIFNYLFVLSFLSQGYALDESCYGNPPLFLKSPHIRTFLYGEVFFASAREEGLCFAISSNGNPLQGKWLEPSDKWHPGFRIGFGSHLAHDFWELSGDWSYFYTEQIQTAHAGFASVGSTFLTPLFIDSSSYSQLLGGKSLQEAKESWQLFFNALSFTLSRPYFLSKQLAVKPQAGLFAAWINQDLAISYTTYASPPGGGDDVVNYNSVIDNNTWRVGPSIGSSVDWYIRRKFRVFGLIRTAALYRSLNYQQIQNSVGNSEGDFRIHLYKNQNRLQPWLDCGLGASWGTFFRKRTAYFEAALQYESQFFWHEFASRILYQQVSGTQDRSLDQSGDLSLQSVALRVRIDF